MNASSSPARSRSSRRRSASASGGAASRGISEDSVTSGPYPAPPGSPPRLCKSAPPMAERLIGVDVGGTKVPVAFLGDGRVSDPVLRPADQRGAAELVAQLIEAIRAAGPADAVGVGVPSVIDFETGMARTSVNIPLQGVPLRQILTDALGFPAFVDNDATVAALAEAFDDDLRPIAQTLVMITVGTGIGGGIVINGRIFRGATGAAPEIGHIIIGADLRTGAPALGKAPQHETLEDLASGRALDRLLNLGG